MNGFLSKISSVVNKSKGIQYYTYNAVPNCSIEISVPGQPPVLRTNLKQFTSDHLEVEVKHADRAGFGVFRCRILQDGHEVFNKWVEINAWTGLLGKGNMKDLADQTTVIVNDICISHCFYDAPDMDNPGGLPDWDQFYVTVTPNFSTWLSTLAPPGSPLAAKPFKRLVLTAAHDIGMNSMQTAVAILQRAGAVFLQAMAPHMPVLAKLPVNDKSLVLPLVPNIIQSAAITQKDTLKTVLAVGARYFEFRPAYLHKTIRNTPALGDMPDKLYFMHGPIPGMSYATFLADCVDFLARNPGEIIVVQLRWDGVPVECARPSAEDLKSVLDHTLPATPDVRAGNLDDMRSLTIDQLRIQKKRLIILQDIDHYSIYSDEGNATLNGDSIIAQFEKISTNSQRGKAFTNIQCQATATNLKKIWFSALSITASNSWLLCTKAICDSKTLPWVRSRALERLGEDQLLVVMDDFVDGAVGDVCRELSAKRLSL